MRFIMVFGVAALSYVLACSSFDSLTFSQAVVQAKTAKESPLRVGVIPFKNITRNPQDDWLSDSFAESLTMGLARVKSLRLIERTQMAKVLKEQQFGQSLYIKTESAPEIGQLLGAEVLLMGSYQKIGEQIQINVRLVNVNSGEVDSTRVTQVEGRFENIFTLQKQLIRQLLPAITSGQPLAEADVATVESKLTGTQSVSAYEWYMKGLQQLRYGDLKQLRQAESYFKKALSSSPDYVLAELGLAETYLSRAQLLKGLMVYPEGLSPDSVTQLVQQSESRVQRALESGQDSSLAYRVLSRLASFQGRHVQALKFSKEAVQMNPNDGDSVSAYFDAQFKAFAYDLDINALNTDLESMGARTQDPWYQIRLAEYLYQVGSDLSKTDLLQQANAILDTIYPQLPKTLKVPLLQAQIAFHQKDKALALRKLSIAYSLAKNNAQNLAHLAGLAYKYGSPENAELWLSRSESLEPQNTEAILQRGEILLAQKNVKKAELLYNQLDKKNNKHPVVPYRLGSYYVFEKEAYADALPYFQEALDRTKNFPSFGYGRSASLVMFCQYMLGDFDTAARTAKTLLDDSEHYEMAYNILALNYSLQGQYQKALASYQSLLRIHPELKNDKALMKWYRRAYLEVEIRNQPDNVPVLVDLGNIVLSQTLDQSSAKSRETGFKAASYYFEKAYKLQPDYYQTAHGMGYLYLQWDKADQAIRYFKETTVLKPDYVKGWYNLGLAYAQKEQFSLARQAWSKVLSLEPSHRAAQTALSGLAE